MGKLKYSLILASALVVSPLAAANAADLIPEPMPVPAPIPVPGCCGGAFYLKGFIGFSNQQADDFTNNIIEGGGFTIETKEFDSAPFIGGGIGYEFSERFRFDGTVEYRGRSNFKGLDTFVSTGVGPGFSTNEYMGHKSEWLFMANGFWDIANIHGVVPYIGAGIGVVNVNLDNFTDVNLVSNGLHWADDGSEWNFAWAIHAGVGYEVTDGLTIDLAYRYLDMGDGTTGNFQTFDPTATSPGPLTVEDITSHDFMVGFRWKWDDGACCETAAYAPAPYK